eukprot:CAMPEP_0167750486 /NCGR_PEP_ID=MMETSP0110_2-20121227/6021_1 /TAXON_ID=629695 /ORGANISM="Gymnochlora sp., Strain CCMP2014" /LENGTH=224 /DNA_ID=CAMNT_0007635819 /DNA_START=365 /DNA_END=1039 /DNA_ORIENTATION=+
MKVILKKKEERLRVLQERMQLTRKKKVRLLLQIYPISAMSESLCKIVGIQLQDSTHKIRLDKKNVTRVSTALGYALLLTKLLAKIMFIPLPHKMVFKSSNSFVVDGKHDKRFAFRDQSEFPHALRILDENIMFLCRQAGVPEEQLTRYFLLPNLRNLLFKIDHPSACLPSLPEKKVFSSALDVTQFHKRPYESNLSVSMFSTVGSRKVRNAQVEDVSEEDWTLI